MNNNTTYSVSIYSLVDPFTSKAFYVGATKLKLSIRLSQHISSSRYSNNSASKWYKKEQTIKDILAKGQRPSIVLLESVPLYQVNEKERFYVDLLNKFFDLEQEPGMCTYTNTAYTRIKNGNQVIKWWLHTDKRPDRYDYDSGRCIPCTELGILFDKPYSQIQSI